MNNRQFLNEYCEVSVYHIKHMHFFFVIFHIKKQHNI